jgi:hypothetical protein
MIKLKPVVLILIGSGLLSGCGAPTSHSMQVQPVVRIDQPGNQAASWNRLGRYHHEKGQLALALGAYAQSLTLDANQMEARNAVAVIEAQQGNLDSARQALIALVNDYPGEAQPHTNLGYVYYLMGDQANATRTLRRAMALGAGPKAYQNLQLAEAALHKSDGSAPPAMLASAEVPATAPAPAAPIPPAPTATIVEVATPHKAAPPAMQVVDPQQVASRMELVQVTPNVFDLRDRVIVAAPAAAVAPVVVAAAPKPAPVKVMQSIPEAASTTVARAPQMAPQLQAAVQAIPQLAIQPAVARLPLSKPVAPATLAVAMADKVDMARLEIANGNGISGMARRFRSLLGQLGIPVNRLSNDKPYRQAATTIQYRPGFEKQAASLQKALQGKAQLASRQLSASDVRLVLGKDAHISLTDAAAAAGLTLMAVQEDSN